MNQKQMQKKNSQKEKRNIIIMMFTVKLFYNIYITWEVYIVEYINTICIFINFKSNHCRLVWPDLSVCLYIYLPMVTILNGLFNYDEYRQSLWRWFERNHSSFGYPLGLSAQSCVYFVHSSSPSSSVLSKCLLSNRWICHINLFLWCEFGSLSNQLLFLLSYIEIVAFKICSV